MCVLHCSSLELPLTRPRWVSRRCGANSAKAEDAVDIDRIEFLAELAQIATDDGCEFQSLASQPPKLVTVAAESFTRLRCSEIRFDGRETRSDLADPRAAYAEPASNLTIAVAGVQKLGNSACLVNEVRGQ